MTDDPGAVGMLDQFEAERAECETLVPLARNRRLRRDMWIGEAIGWALRQLDDDPTLGPVPIVRAVDSKHVTTYRRDGTTPIPPMPITVCWGRGCGRRLDFGEAVVPFWINCGHVIVQIDLCGTCADHAIFNLDAEPQNMVS